MDQILFADAASGASVAHKRPPATRDVAAIAREVSEIFPAMFFTDDSTRDSV